MKLVKLVLIITLLLWASLTLAADGKKKEEVVEIGGMSIIGNRELPKTLYIVPWKDSDINSETDLSRDLLNERLRVVDQEEFGRQLKYYDLSK
jgi:hypothetical protein